jgi:hypothetical protein
MEWGTSEPGAGYPDPLRPEKSQKMEARSRTRKTAHFLERIGLALAGASCGLFVAAHVARASFEVLASTTAVLAMTCYGAIGFYLGIDIPPHAALAGRTDPAELFSAIGTFLAATAAFVSVYSIVVDTDSHIVWTAIVWACWLIGVTFQIVAGAIARLRAL